MKAEAKVAKTILALLTEAVENNSLENDAEGGGGLDSVDFHAEYEPNTFTVRSGRHVFAVEVRKVR